MTFDTWLTTTGPSQNIPQTNFGWAAQYQSYMDNYIGARSGQISSLISRLIPAIQSDLTVASTISGSSSSTLSQEQNLLSAFQNTYGSGNGVEFTLSWEWDATNVKREEIPNEKRAACEASSSASPNSSVSATGTAASSSFASTDTATPVTTTSSVTSSTSLLIGPTVFCEGFSPGGGDSCLTISAGCYATSPTYNYAPQTTCTGSAATSTTTTTSQPASTPSSSSTTTSTTPTPTPTPAYNPTGTSSCAGGSSLCRSNPEMGSMCHTAMERWNDTEIYNAYSSLTYINGANEAFTDDGCSAIFDCGSNSYPAISGADLKTAFGLIGCSVCGSHLLLQAGCEVKLDA